MIDSFTISNERFINNEYYAKLETTFNKKKILNFLERNSIFPSIPIKNKVLLIPILVDIESNSVYLFDNIFYKRWNKKKEKYQLLDYILPTEDLEDLSKIQNMLDSIDTYDFANLIKKYDLKDHIILIIYKNKDEFKTLSKINLNDSLKINNKTYSQINLNNEEDVEKILKKLKNTYEDQWKKNNEINTSIKLPLTLSIKSGEYKKIIALENTLNNIDLVADFYISNFDNNNTQYKLIYNGPPNFFFNDMNNKNFNLVIENNIWIIK